nr:DUF1810 domain-containing protein [Sphingomonas sp.]
MIASVSDPYNLRRFINAQASIFESALAELRAGKKRTHWMWFIFPQLRGLGQSVAAQYYGIGSLDEAGVYLDHLVLGPNLREATEAMVSWSARRTAEQVLGPVDAMKLRSSMTLFDQVEPNGLFDEALDGFYRGERDKRTLELLNARA